MHYCLLHKITKSQPPNNLLCMKKANIYVEHSLIAAKEQVCVQRIIMGRQKIYGRHGNFGLYKTEGENTLGRKGRELSCNCWRRLNWKMQKKSGRFLKKYCTETIRRMLFAHLTGLLVWTMGAWFTKPPVLAPSLHGGGVLIPYKSWYADAGHRGAFASLPHDRAPSWQAVQRLRWLQNFSPYIMAWNVTDCSLLPQVHDRHLIFF